MRILAPVVLYSVMSWIAYYHIAPMAMWSGMIFYLIGMGAGHAVWGYETVDNEETDD